jgi:hypothetical protein
MRETLMVVSIDGAICDRRLTVFGALSTRAHPRRVSIAAAAIGWFVLGYIALWSVGMLLILAGLLAVL